MAPSKQKNSTTSTRNTVNKKSISTKSSKQKNQLGVAHIQASFNNTIVTISTPSGDTLAWSSPGERKFKGTRKGTPFAARSAALEVGTRVKAAGMQKIEVNVKGPGPGREMAIRGLQEAGLRIAVIRDITGIPHNGCRPPKKRRV